MVHELNQGNLAIFAGAGLSKGSGAVDWAELLETPAKNIGLDSNKEQDLIRLAQYCVNEKFGNKNELYELIYNNFDSYKTNENHKILSRLPISTFWTTNYDHLIEDSLVEQRKNIDVKKRDTDLCINKNNRDAVVYKMHGDKDDPEHVVITMEDYDSYFINHHSFSIALSDDLRSKTFLFIGYSFNDIDFKQILKQIKLDVGKSQRTHYCFMKEPNEQEYNNKEIYNTEKKKYILFVKDLLMRYNIETISVEKFEDITLILNKIERQFNCKTIYISGAAAEYGSHSADEYATFIANLSGSLVHEGFRIVSGYGLGVGSSVVSGVLNEVYFKEKKTLDDQLILRPFPLGKIDEGSWHQYRKDMIAYTGISIFLLGNKVDKQTKKIILSNGMDDEYNISKDFGNILIPIGATGYKAKEYWDKENARVLKNESPPYSDEDKQELFQQIGNDQLSFEDLKDAIVKLVKLFNK